MAGEVVLDTAVVELVGRTTGLDRDLKRAAAQVKAAGREMEQTGSLLQQRLTVPLAQAAATADRSFLRIQRDIQQAGTDFRKGAISVGDYKGALDFARAEAIALKDAGLKPAGAELKAFNGVMTATGGASRISAGGMGRLRQEVGSVAFQAVGLPGVFGRASASILGLSIGALTSAGVFIGLAAIATAIAKISEASREAKKRVDDFVKSSKSVRAAQQEITRAFAEQEAAGIRQLLAAGGRTRTRQIGGPEGGRSVQEFVPLSDAELKKLIDRLHDLSLAAKDVATEGIDKLIDSLNRKMSANAIRAPDINLAGGGPNLQGLVAVLRELYPNVGKPGKEPGFGFDVASVNRRVEQIIGSVRTVDAEHAMDLLGQVNKVLAETGMQASQLVEPLQRIIAGLLDRAALQAPTGTSFFGGIGDQLKALFDPKEMFSNLVANIATSGLSALVGGVTALVGKLFQENPYQAAHIKAINDNSKQLANLTRGVQKLDSSAVLGQANIGAARSAVQAYIDQPGAGNPNVSGWNTLAIYLHQMGITFDELVEIGRTFGIVIDGSVKSLEQFIEALNTEWLQNATQTFSGGWDLLQKQFQLLDTTPLEQFQQEIEFVSGLVGDDLAKQLKSLNASNIDEFIKDFLAQIRAGTLDLSQLGGLSIEDFIQFLLAAESALDGLGDAARQASQDLLNVPEGFKVALQVFRATQGQAAIADALGGNGGSGAGSGGGGGRGTGPGSATYSFGDVNIATARDDTPEVVFQKFQEGMRRARARGGALDVEFAT